MAALIGYSDPARAALVLGQDAAFAGELADRFSTVGGIVAGLADAAAGQIRSARRVDPLAEGAALAQDHGTRYPILQGPMTRVSDRPEFAVAVAEGGALPLLALALMRGDESAALLERTKALIGARPWGVGILGFVPPELRAEQLAAIRASRPPFALIAGGRPDQARALEDDGIRTYLHVPSPGLLRQYFGAGARRFVFEGRECGGHVGPRTSFVLWDMMVRELLAALGKRGDASELCVALAGGIHDARSAAMAAAIAAPLADRGARVGVLLGTAYLFTEEAVRSGAITARFQQAAVEANSTVLLETGPGHATRCLPSPFADEFERSRRELERSGASPAEQRERLELLNLGRLRLASKGTERNPRHGEDADAPKLVDVAERDQWQRGMYMIGQVSALRDRVGTVAELHASIASGGRDVLGAIHVPDSRVPAPSPADVAIVGMGCVFPGAPDLRTYWDNILAKVDAVTEVPASRWDWRRYFDADRTAPDRIYSRWGGFVDDVEFDARDFGMTPNSLRSIEPFQLLALLVARAALHDAGYERRPFPRERTSVILGAGGGGADLAVGYTVRASLPSLFGDAPRWLRGPVGERLPEWTEDSFPGLLMNVAAGRIANRLDLGGTNYTVDAACASALAAVALAVRELRDGTSDMAVAGAVDAIQNPFAYLCFSKTKALSPNGRCRPFDAKADGIAISEGFAAVILKRLSDAERDGDRIYAVVRGIGAASDGRDRSLTAPRPEGQMRALQRAYAQARVSPATVSLVEAHGTGTVAGDRAEVQALSAVFDAADTPRQQCAIGSVKSMIGHTKATAGVAGLIKAALALHHRVLPPTLGVSTPSPAADFPSSPFYVNSEARPWLTGTAGQPRRAGVSAFGFGGTDFHAVLEEYTGGYLPESAPTSATWPAELLLWRAPGPEGLLAATAPIAAALADGMRPPLADLAATLAAAAPPEGVTLALVAGSVEELQERLTAARDALAAGEARRQGGGVHFATAPLLREGEIAFLFPGQGSQYVGMARELAVAFPAVRATFERADAVLAGRHPLPLSRYIFPPPTFERAEERAQQAQLTQTDVAQPALGATELAHLELLRSLGIEPAMTAGHSYGELVALAAAGAIDEAELLLLSEARGRFIREGAGEDAGTMAAVEAGPDELVELAQAGDVVLANLNAPRQTVLSGPRAAVERAVEWCTAHGLRARALPVACGFHSPCVEPARQRLAALLADARITPPRLPVFSNTTGRVYPGDPAQIAALLAEHLVRPVEFVREVEAMHAAGGRVFVEVGPRNVLTGLVGRVLGDRPHIAVAVDRPGDHGQTALLECLAALAAEGAPVAHDALFAGRSSQQLDLMTLAPATPPPARTAATWLVNGGRARPASESLTPPVPVEIEELRMTATNGAAAPAAPQPAPGPAYPAGDVMAHYQRLMQQFLDTQRSVMLAYLGQAAPVSPADAQAPPALAVPAAPALELPPVTAVAGNGTQAHAEAPPPPSDGSSPPADVRARLLEIVSDRTGYPVEMLDLDADMEADLSIDSIKRVEIAGTLSETLVLPAGVTLDVDELIGSRTLTQVIALLERVTGNSATAAPDTAQEREALPFEPAPDDGRIGRYVLHATGAPEATENAGLAADGIVVIVDDETGIGEALAERLGRRGDRVVRVVSSAGGTGTLQADLADLAALSALAAELEARHGPAKALVYLAPLGVRPAADGALLALLQRLREPLDAAAAAGGAAVLGATRMGGAFAVDDAPAALDPAQALIPGLLKSLAHEWPGVRVKAVDLDEPAPPVAAARLLAELLSADGLVEVGYREDVRTALTTVPAPLAGREEFVPLEAGAVVLVTGGARGITAEAALALAEREPALTLVLAGRTNAAEEEAETAGLEDPRALRRAMLERRRERGLQASAAAVEPEVRMLLRAREVRRTLARLRATGAHVDYRVCDVSDPEGLTALVGALYAAYGRLDGVIHGAGVIEDRLVRDKTLDSFDRVVATKAGAARVLATCLRPEGLRFLVFFSSVASRFGNRGQADYAAAGEVLNKLAQELDRRWDARVVSINWGPWKAGMVTPEIERQFALHGVEPIPVETGRRRFGEELRRGRKGEAEVVIGGVTESAARAPALLGPEATITQRADGGIEILRPLDPEHDRYLDDHRLDGTPVLPFAVAMELMAETASAGHPDLEVVHLRRIRLNQGIAVEAGEAVVRVVAVPVEGRAGPATSLDVTIVADDGRPPRYRASVDLAPRGAVPPSVEAPAPLDAEPSFSLSVDEAYREHLFHGPVFQNIEAVTGMNERGATALLRCSAPADCLADTGPSGWILDPVLVDCALQVQVLWARRFWDVTPLPAQIDGFRRFAGIAPGDVVRHELRVRETSRPPLCVADHWIYAADGRLLATLTGVQGVGSRALNRLASVSA